MPKLHIKLKNGEERTYNWHEVDFSVTSIAVFVVRNTTCGTLEFAAPMDRLEYYERVEE